MPMGFVKAEELKKGSDGMIDLPDTIKPCLNCGSDVDAVIA